MKKCTLCVDRIYNENLPEEDRVPACVRACPTGARHFGDLGDPGQRRVPAGGRARRLRSDARDRLQAGQQIPAAAHRPRRSTAPTAPAMSRPSAGRHRRGSAADKLFAWVDRMLSR